MKRVLPCACAHEGAPYAHEGAPCAHEGQRPWHRLPLFTPAAQVRGYRTAGLLSPTWNVLTAPHSQLVVAALHAP